MQYEYAEYAIGGFDKRNKIYNVKDFQLNGIRNECFRSIFLFDKGIEDYVKRNKTVSGYSGDHTADQLIFDFDGEDLGAVKKEVRDFALHIHSQYEVPKKYFRIYFSGAKGFHIAMPFAVLSEFREGDRNFWHRYRLIAVELAGGFKFFDRSIYEARRLIRIENTINNKSGLYKIPLDFAELENLKIEEIKSLAENPREIELLPEEEMLCVPYLYDLYQKYSSKTVQTNTSQNVSGTDSTKRQELLSILSQGAEKGNRHNSLIKLVGLLANKNLDFDFIMASLKNWNLLNLPPLKDEELEYEVARAFKPSGKAKSDDNVEIYNLKRASGKYCKYVKEIEKHKVTTGFSFIDKKIRGIFPGETMCILGMTSIGKSAFLQNIGQNYAKISAEPVLFFSLEMPLHLVFERTLQIETGFSGREVEERFKHSEGQLLLKTDRTVNELSNFYVVEKSGLDLENIKKTIIKGEEEVYHRKTGLVLIDYLGLIRQKGDDLYAQVSNTARGIKELAKELAVPIIFLSQVNRKYTSAFQLEIGAARDSGVIDEASDFILGLWTEKTNQYDFTQDFKNIQLGILKNRKGGIGQISIKLDKKSLKFYE